ncbi:uncharacterized protein EAE97_008377 [Botrytis byssoidea]|uniref:Uncharacterized protein n=1 Tax=Botrytis byssoidea TaxID=139641 RepID=A0A9P5I774_9HELO|nr:uncharacterized protein EAE97_008377 [Botrytis byssoidea]KAF7934017.1 hypothetical protein EAE97_008377 [Botrytis byssoidea]
MPVASIALTPYSNYLAPEQMEVEENEKKCDESNKSTRPIRQNFDIATGSRMMSKSPIRQKSIHFEENFESSSLNTLYNTRHYHSQLLHHLDQVPYHLLWGTQIVHNCHTGI